MNALILSTVMYGSYSPVSYCVKQISHISSLKINVIIEDLMLQNIGTRLD